MDRPGRSASKVTNYRQFHLSGDLGEVIQGKVSETIDKLQVAIGEPRQTPRIPNMDEDAQQLRSKAEELKAHNSKMQMEAENMKLRNEVEEQELQKEQWEMAMTQHRQAREKMLEEHRKIMDQMKAMSQDAVARTGSQAVAWLQGELNGLNGQASIDPEKERAEKAEREKALLVQELQRQQEALQKQILDITNGTQGSSPSHHPNPSTNNNSQEALIEQLTAALGGRDEERDQNKALLKALLTANNRTSGSSGTSTLRPELISKLTSPGEFSMAEWLASLNKQEEGEFDITRVLNKDDESDCRQECRHQQRKSGMLDKSTTNIRHKEVWPQKNLGEDWVEEEIEFKQLRFEHLVAGETRTIETCTDPAQILGRLRLLRRIAYLKLRGIEWHLLRKMYAAILSSIETREHSRESNFDRFESILYRKVWSERQMDRERESNNRPSEGRKRYCRDYNRPEGCPKSSPHMVWMGSGPSATKRMVYHCCAACLVRDKVPKEHPEGHNDCPHRT